MPVSRLVILGRDGVINHDPGQPIADAEAWEPIPGSLEAIARLTQAGLRVAVATNQPGLASGALELEALNMIHRKLHDSLDRLGGQIAAIACCPHAPDQACGCRKPDLGMYQQLAERFGVTLNELVVIGRDSDMQAAASLGVLGLRIAGPGAKPDPDDPIPYYDDLAHATSALLIED